MAVSGEDAAAREAIAQALWVADEGPKRADEWWDAGEYEAVRAACYRRADAVLALLVPAPFGWCPVHAGSSCPEDYMLRRDGSVAAGYQGRWSEDMRCGRRQPTYRIGHTGSDAR